MVQNGSKLAENLKQNFKILLKFEFFYYSQMLSQLYSHKKGEFFKAGRQTCRGIKEKQAILGLKVRGEGHSSS